MTTHNISCPKCGGSFDIKTYREYVTCPYCKNKTDFPGFNYRIINWRMSMYANVKKWMDCPACRSPNMYLGPSGRRWKCPDCGYSISRIKKNTGVFWFCDDCGTYLNVQDGFTTKSGKWICSECLFENDVTKANIY